jgi:hypothetical protein
MSSNILKITLHRWGNATSIGTMDIDDGTASI